MGGYMKGIKGYGHSPIPRDASGHELVSTGDLLLAFPQSRVGLLRFLKGAGFTPDPIIRGNRGERYWTRQDVVPVLARRHLQRE